MTNKYNHKVNQPEDIKVIKKKVKNIYEKVDFGEREKRFEKTLKRIQTDFEGNFILEK
jgi:hypothetical protein